MAALLALLPRASLLEISAGDPVVLRVPAAAGDTVSLDYTHSMYDAPVHEVYRLTGERGLVLVSAASSAAALEYSGWWADRYLPDGAGVVALDRTIGALVLSVDSVGRPALTVGRARLDLRGTLGQEGRARLALSNGPRLLAWLDGLRQAGALVVEEAGTGDRVWSGPVLPGETFTVSYAIAAYGDRLAETFVVARDGSLRLLGAAYGSAALAGDCSIQCDRLGRAEGDLGPQRVAPSLTFRLSPESGLTLTHRAIDSALVSRTDGALRLRVAGGPAAWAAAASSQW